MSDCSPEGVGSSNVKVVRSSDGGFVSCGVGILFAGYFEPELSREVTTSSESEHGDEPLDESEEPARLLQGLSIEEHGEVII